MNIHNKLLKQSCLSTFKNHSLSNISFQEKNHQRMICRLGKVVGINFHIKNMNSNPKDLRY